MSLAALEGADAQSDRDAPAARGRELEVLPVVAIRQVLDRHPAGTEHPDAVVELEPAVEHDTVAVEAADREVVRGDVDRLVVDAWRDEDQIALAGVGGGTALLSHLTKAGIRLAVNTSPEPVTNIGVSVLEDLAVLGLVALAVQHPRIAAAVAAVLLVVGLVLLYLAAKLVRRGWRRWKGRRSTPAGTPP